MRRPWFAEHLGKMVREEVQRELRRIMGLAAMQPKKKRRRRRRLRAVNGKRAAA
jgi:hypothetical protein